MTYEEFKRQLDEQVATAKLPCGMYYMIARNKNYDPEHFDEAFHKKGQTEWIDYLEKQMDDPYFCQDEYKPSSEWLENRKRGIPLIVVDSFMVEHDPVFGENQPSEYLIGEKAKKVALEHFKKCVENGEDIVICTMLQPDFSAKLKIV